MTISSATRKAGPFLGNGVTTAFPFTFKVFAATDLQAIKTSTAGVDLPVLVLNSDYSVALNADQNANPGGSITYPLSGAFLATNEKLTVTGVLAALQGTHITNGGNFFANNIEDQMDYLTILEQQHDEKLSRAILASPSDVSPLLSIGTAIQRALKYIGFDALGNLSLSQALPSGTLSLASILSFLGADPIIRQTAAELAAGVVPSNLSYQPYDLRRYGADPTGVAASDAALTAAIAVCGSVGGTIRLPNGKYTFASPITALANKTGIILQGDGSATGGAQPATQIVYSGTGAGIFIDFRSSIGCKIRDCQILHTNAGYTGTYMKFGNDGSHGDGPFCELSNCVVGSSVNGVGNVHVDLDKCICFTAYHCNFIYGNPSVKGMAASSYSNVIHFRDCHFYQNYVAPINSQGQSWTFEGCTFEQLVSGAGGAIAGAVAGTSPAVGLIIKGCWFGDVTNTAPAGTWIDGCLNGAEISGNYFSGNATSNNTTGIALRQASAVAIIGNFFTALNTAINFVTGNCYGICCKGNSGTSIGTFYTGTANVPLGQLSFGLGFGFGIPTGHGATGQNGYAVYPDGHIEQWGYVNPASFGVHAITPFLVAFPTACDNVVVQLSGVVSTAATIYAGTLTTTGFTYTLTDGTSATDSFYWRAVGR